MAMVLAVLTFAAFIALDYFVLRRRNAVRVQATGPARPPLEAARQRVPEDVYLQPTFTWGRLGEAGEVYLGIHPMLLSLVGAPFDLEFLKEGARVAKGAPLARITKEGRTLTVRSPLAGRLDVVNRQGGNGAWLYRLQPDRVADELPGWFAGEVALEWTRRQYDALRTYLQNAVAEGHLGPVMADGGELPPGVLGGLDASVWSGLDDRFLAHGS